MGRTKLLPFFALLLLTGCLNRFSANADSSSSEEDKGGALLAGAVGAGILSKTLPKLRSDNVPIGWNGVKPEKKSRFSWLRSILPRSRKSRECEENAAIVRALQNGYNPQMPYVKSGRYPRSTETLEQPKKKSIFRRILDQWPRLIPIFVKRALRNKDKHNEQSSPAYQNGYPSPYPASPYMRSQTYQMSEQQQPMKKKGLLRRMLPLLRFLPRVLRRNRKGKKDASASMAPQMNENQNTLRPWNWRARSSPRRFDSSLDPEKSEQKKAGRFKRLAIALLPFLFRRNKSDSNKLSSEKQSLLKPSTWLRRSKRSLDSDSNKDVTSQDPSQKKKNSKKRFLWLIPSFLLLHHHRHHHDDEHKDQDQAKRSLIKPSTWRQRSGKSSDEENKEVKEKTKEKHHKRFLWLLFPLIAHHRRHHEKDSKEEASLEQKPVSSWLTRRRRSSDQDEEKKGRFGFMRKALLLLPLRYLHHGKKKSNYEKSHLTTGPETKIVYKCCEEKKKRNIWAKIFPLGLGLGLSYKLGLVHSNRHNHKKAENEQPLQFSQSAKGPLMLPSSASGLVPMADSRMESKTTVIQDPTNTKKVTLEVEPYYVDSDQSDKKTEIIVDNGAGEKVTVIDKSTGTGNSALGDLAKASEVVKIIKDGDGNTKIVTEMKPDNGMSPSSASSSLRKSALDDPAKASEAVKIIEDADGNTKIVTEMKSDNGMSPSSASSSLAKSASGSDDPSSTSDYASDMDTDSDEEEIPSEATQFEEGKPSAWLQKKIAQEEENGEPVDWMWMYRRYKNAASPSFWSSKGIDPSSASSGRWTVENIPAEAKNYEDGKSSQWLWRIIQRLNSRGEPIDWAWMYRYYKDAASPGFWRAQGINTSTGQWQEEKLDVPQEAYQFEPGQSSYWLRNLIERYRREGRVINWGWLYKQYGSTASPEWWASKGVNTNRRSWWRFNKNNNSQWGMQRMSIPQSAYTYQAGGASSWLTSLLQRYRSSGQRINWNQMYRYYRPTASKEFWQSQGVDTVKLDTEMGESSPSQPSEPLSPSPSATSVASSSDYGGDDADSDEGSGSRRPSWLRRARSAVSRRQQQTDK